MALNYDQAKIALEQLFDVYGFEGDRGVPYMELLSFIRDVEKLMKRNSIRQIPAICRPFDEGD